MMNTAPTKQRPTTHRRTLLTLGDTEWVREKIKAQLQGRAELIVEANGTEQALAYLREHNADVIILQANSPACAKVVEDLQHQCGAPILAIGSSDSADAAVVAGALDFIVTPCTRMALVRRLDLILESAQAANQSVFEWALEGISNDQAVAHWEIDVLTGEMTWSPSIKRMLSDEAQSEVTTVTGLLGQLLPEDRSKLQRNFDALMASHQAKVEAGIRIHDGSNWQRFKLVGELIPGDDLIFGTLTEHGHTSPAAMQRMLSLDVDPVTQLPRQTALLQRISNSLSRPRTGINAVLAIDIPALGDDKFKSDIELQDSFRLAITQRLLAALPPESLLGVETSQRFIAVLENLPSSNVADKLSQQIIKQLAQPYYSGDAQLSAPANISICIAPTDSNDATELLAFANQTIELINTQLEQQQQQPGTALFYCDTQARGSSVRLSITELLYRAIPNGELEVYYQPQVDVTGEKITGVEALLRWTNPELGKVSPALFIPVAEEIGLIEQIGEWVIDAVSKQAAAWRSAGLTGFRISINLSPKQLLNDKVEQSLQSAARQYGIDLAMFDLELTETTEIDDIHSVQKQLNKLRKCGATVSLDDFGTRYSALSYLQDIDIDGLKIDRAFISNIDKQQNSAVTEAILAMASTLHKNLVAEGVETPSQRDFLLQRGCNVMQGFYFSEPVDAETTTELLRKGFHALPQGANLLGQGT